MDYEKATKALEKYQVEKPAALSFQQRRHIDWNENYLLYRNRVALNRLTQRQEVSIPLMKETIRTILAKIDEDPDVYFEDLGGDLDKEILINELFENFKKDNHISLLDRVDKKQVMLYGRSHRKLNWDGEKVTLELKDPFDILIDPKTLPYDIDSARFIIETGILKPLEEVIHDERYDQQARGLIKERYTPNQTKGEVITSRTEQEQQDRDERMTQMDVDSDQDFAGSEVVLSLDQHFTFLWDEEKKEYVRYVSVIADSDVVLSCKPLKEVLGVNNFWPFESWADDLESTDYYSDAVADIIRQPNKIINTWLSQEIENRTLANFGMNFYDSTIEGFEPVAWEPRPFGWYPLPGKPSEVLERVNVAPFPGNMESINYLIGLVEKATASGAVEKGSLSDEKRTLGEIEITVAKAMERINSMTPFYRLCWQRTAEKWRQIMEANVDNKKKFKLYKKGYDGRMREVVIKKSQWTSRKGFRVRVENKRQREAEDVNELNNMFAIQQKIPNNPPLDAAIRRKALKTLGLSPEEIREIDEFEKKKVEEMRNAPQAGQQSNPMNQAGPLPAQPLPV